ncbi:hypothetical protein K3727_13280 [Rhodobacteraceae bacterium M382]|nr:hypothetical protein K3727_13280 [Rhodobacteraceae bacterium M382]
MIGCTRVPEIEERVSDDMRNADYPELVTLDSALETLPRPNQAGQELEQALAARSARLQRRADQLRSTTQ